MHEKLLTLIRDNPVEVLRWVGFDLLTDLHNDWLRQFLFSTTDVTTQAHRGSFKSTALDGAMALHILLEPNANIIFCRKTDTDVKESIKTVQGILRSGAFQTLSRELWGVPLLLTRDTQNEIVTSLQTTVKGTPQILGVGCGSSITGKHADVIITDDIINIKDRVSRAERERTKLFFMELQNVKNRGGRFINCGTPWHKDDAFQLMGNIQRFDCYMTGLIGKEELHEIRRSMTDSLFAANYELKHIADTNALFHEPNYTNNDAMLYDGVAHIDAAYGGADFTAYTIMKRHNDGTVTAYGRLFDRHVSDCIETICALQDRFKVGTIYNENNGDKGFLNKELQAHGLRGQSYHEKQNKYVKITTYLKKDWHNITWLDDSDPEYINQILDYTENAEHDDAPDSAASLLRQMGTTVKFNRVRGGL